MFLGNFVSLQIYQLSFFLIIYMCKQVGNYIDKKEEQESL